MNALDMMGKGPKWMSTQLWDELSKMHRLREDCMEKCKQAQKSRMADKHTCDSVPHEANKQGVRNDLKRRTDNIELFEQCDGRSQRDGVFVDKKSKRVREECIKKQGCSNPSSQPQFDLPSWYESTGTPSKARLHGVGCSHRPERAHSEASVNSYVPKREFKTGLEELQNKLGELYRKTKEDYGRRLEEVWRREFEVVKKECELRKREAEVRVREQMAQLMNENFEDRIRKLIQEMGYTNCQDAGGSGQFEQPDLERNI